MARTLLWRFTLVSAQSSHSSPSPRAPNRCRPPVGAARVFAGGDQPQSIFHQFRHDLDHPAEHIAVGVVPPDREARCCRMSPVSIP